MKFKIRKHNPLLQLLLFAIILVPVVAGVPVVPGMEITQNNQIHKLGTSDYVVVPISINVVQGTTISKETIEANIKRMNEIYNCEVVIFVWDGTINTIPDPDGNGDGAVSGADNRSSVRGSASTNAGGSGVSITVSSGLGPNINGYSTVGGAHGPIVTNSTNGDTWAHEMQHALGQSHGPAQPADEDINGAAPGNGTGWDVNGDGRVTSADQGYNLWGRASDRTGDAINCGAIFNASKEIPGAVVKHRPQIIQTKPKNTTKTGVASGPKSDVKNTTMHSALAPYVDIIGGGLIKNYTTMMLKFWLQIAKMPIDNCSYDLCFDYIPGSGDLGNPFFLNADLRVEFSTWWSGGWEVYVFVWNNITLNWIFTLNFGDFVQNIKPRNETISYDNDTGSGWVDSFFDVYFDVETTEPWLVSDLEGIFNMWIVSEWWDMAGPESFLDQTLPVEVNLNSQGVRTLSISGENVTGTKTMQVTGMLYMPNGNVSLYIDGLYLGSVTADPSGNFSTTITVPNATKDNAILLVMDEVGNGDAAYINTEAFIVIPQPSPIPFGLFPVALVALTLVLFIKSKRKNELF